MGCNRWLNSKLVRLYIPLTVALLFVALATTHTIGMPRNTEVGGPIVSDTTWTLANSPYIVTSNVQVWEDVTLTIEPGVSVKFQDGKRLQIDGIIVARGATNTPITFTSNQPVPTRGDWDRIVFTESSVDAVFDLDGNYISGSVLQHCVVEYATPGDLVGVIDITSTSPFIDHCLIQKNGNDGQGPGTHGPIKVTGSPGSPVVLSNNTIRDNRASLASGIYAEATVLIENNTIVNNGEAYLGTVSAVASTLTGNYIANNSALGIHGEDNIISGNTIIANERGGISSRNSNIMDNVVHGNSGTGISGRDSTIIRNIVTENSSQQDGGGIWCGECDVQDNVVSDNVAVRSGGGVYVVGYNNNISGNSITENVAASGGGAWVLYGDVFSNTIVGNQAETDGTGLFVAGSDPVARILNNNIIGNIANTEKIAGGIAANGTHQVHGNNIYGNEPYDALATSFRDVNGVNNYWGTVENVNIVDQIYDWFDDTSLGQFYYIPFLQNPDVNAPVPPPTNLTADFRTNSVLLRWESIPSQTTGYGYKVYYDTDKSGPPYDGTGITGNASPIDVGNASEVMLTGLSDKAYYIAVTAYDTLGRESWYSNEINNAGTNANDGAVYLPLLISN